MGTFTVRNGAWVVVGDGKKVLILQNSGDAELLDLRRVSVRENSNAHSRDQISDSAGRASNTVAGRGGSVGETDWQELEEARFAATIAEDINKAAQGHAFKELIVVAPPKTLAELRREWSKETQRLIVAELPKDLTHHPIPEIESMLLTHRPLTV